jgi:hypothetical protein
MEIFGIFYGHLVHIFYEQSVYSMNILRSFGHIFPRFGMRRQEQTGNPDSLDRGDASQGRRDNRRRFVRFVGEDVFLNAF